MTVIVILIAAFLLYDFTYGGASSGSGGTTSGNYGGSFIDALSAAIAKMENVDPSANNPGALGAGDVPAGNITGQLNDAGVSLIDTLDNGLSALYTKLTNILSGNSSNYSPDMTIQQFAGMYTTGNPNDNSDETNNYAQGLADSLGVTTDTSLSDAQSQYEGTD